MANFNMLQGQVEDYTALMGQYQSDFANYQKDVAQVQDGSKAFALQGNGKTYQAGWDEKNQQIVGRKDVTANAADYQVLQPPTEPKTLSVTRSEATALQNPPQTIAQQEAVAPGILDRAGIRPQKAWDTGTGILGKTMQGKV